jgi:hypothetical protein
MEVMWLGPYRHSELEDQCSVVVTAHAVMEHFYVEIRGRPADGAPSWDPTRSATRSKSGPWGAGVGLCSWPTGGTSVSIVNGVLDRLRLVAKHNFGALKRERSSFVF